MGAYSAGLARLGRLGAPCGGKGYVMQALEAHGKAPRRNATPGSWASAHLCWSSRPRPWPTASGNRPRTATRRGGSTTATTFRNRRHPFPLQATSPVAGTQTGGLQRRHQHHLLVPGLPRLGHPDPGAGGGGHVGPDQPDDHPLRPGRAAHPVLERSGVRARRVNRDKGQGRGDPARRHLVHLHRGRRGPPPPPGAAGRARLPAAHLHPQRRGAAGPERSHAPVRDLRLALAHPAGRTDVAVDPGRERASSPRRP